MSIKAVKNGRGDFQSQSLRLGPISKFVESILQKTHNLLCKYEVNDFTRALLGKFQFFYFNIFNSSTQSMSSKTHNKHIKLDTNLTKRSSDPDNDREISNEKIDIYELCIHPIHYSLTFYPYMYGLSKHHSHYNTSTFTQTY